MPINEPTDENPIRVLSDADNKIVFLPNIIRAQEIYNKDIAPQELINDLEKASYDMYIGSTSKRVDESQIKIGPVTYTLFSNDLDGRNIPITLEPPNKSELPSIEIKMDFQNTKIVSVYIHTPPVEIKGAPPFEIRKAVNYIRKDDELHKNYSGLWVTIPKEKIKFGVPEEEKYDDMVVSIINSEKDGFDASLMLTNELIDSGIGYRFFALSMKEIEKKDLTDYDLKPNEISENITYLDCEQGTFTAFEPGSRKYEIAKGVLLSLVEQVTGKIFQDITPIESW